MSKKPMRIIEGSSKPYQPFWRMVDAAESESGEAEIEFYGYISEYSWYEDDITPSRFKKDLAALNGAPVTVRIHSGGGDVFAASAIRAMLMDYPGRVTTRIDGLCASAATYVATAGDRVLMQDSAFFMIHNPSGIAWGTVDDFKAMIGLLKTIKDGIIESYQSKTKMDYEQLAKMMNDETWLTASKALEYGFVDEVVSARAIKPAMSMSHAAVMNCLTNYENVPPELLAEYAEPAEEEENVPEEAVSSEAAESVAEEEGEGPTPPTPLPEGMGEEETVLADGGLVTDQPLQDEDDLRKLRNYLDVFARR